jgi:hypothetical protein
VWKIAEMVLPEKDEGGSRSLGRSCERRDKQRGISRKKECFCRDHKVSDGLKELFQVVTIDPNTITCCCDHARMPFDEIGGGNASRVDDDMPNTP